MMCVWKRPPASERRPAVTRRWVCLAALVLALALRPAVPAAAVPADPAAPAQAAPRVISFTGDWHPTGQEKDWLKQDQGWFRALPAAGKFLPGGLPPAAVLDSLAVDPAALARFKSRVGAAAAVSGDTLAMVRPVAALLRDRWLDRGYLSATVQAVNDSLQVRPGPVWSVGTMDITGDEFPGRNHLVATWLPREGDVFRRQDWSRGIDMVLVGTGELGYPFPRWVTREVELVPASRTVSITAMLLAGNRACIGPVTCDLAEERAARFLARTSGLRSGQPFRHSDLGRARQRLLARDLYATVGEPQVYLTTSSDTVGIHIPVTARRKINHLQVVLGLSRRDDASGSRLSGEVDLRLPNMAGTGRSLTVGWRDDGRQRSRFGFSYLEPLAFGTPLDMGWALENEVERDAYTRFRLDNVWQLPVVALWGLELGAGWDRSTYPVGVVESTSRVRARGAFLHRRGDRTRSGWEGLFAIENAWRSAGRRPDDAGGLPSAVQLSEAVTQRIFEVDAAGELWLGGSFSLSGRAAFRQLTGGDRVVPLSEQFRFGGAASLRGYREGEFHGSLAAYGGVEARIGRPGGSRLYTFYDLGYFEFWQPDPLAVDPDALMLTSKWPRGYGLGLLARTPAGDISLAIGFPGTVDFDQAKLHVTLLESF